MNTSEVDPSESILLTAALEQQAKILLQSLANIPSSASGILFDTERASTNANFSKNEKDNFTAPTDRPTTIINTPSSAIMKGFKYVTPQYTDTYSCAPSSVQLEQFLQVCLPAVKFSKGAIMLLQRVYDIFCDSVLRASLHHYIHHSNGQAMGDAEVFHVLDELIEWKEIMKRLREKNYISCPKNTTDVELSIEALPRASTLLSSVGVVDSSVPQEEIECDNTNQPASATPSMINPLLLNY